MHLNRRKFILNTIKTTAGLSLGQGMFHSNLWAQNPRINSKIKISLQCFSFAGAFFSQQMSVLDFPKLVREDFNLDGAEYWNIPMISKRKDPQFIKEILQKTSDYGLENTLMLVDLLDFQTGKSTSLCANNKEERTLAIEGHKEWMDVAKSIGCKAIRANLWSEGLNASEAKEISIESLGKLLEYGSAMDLDLVIENHGGYTSDAQWVVELMKAINHPNLGTLPDFGTGNFCIERGPKEEGQRFNTSECIKQYDKYQGVEEMLPYAKGISAKSIAFNAEGEEIHTDFRRMMNLIKTAAFEGYIAIEYEGGFAQMMGGDEAPKLSTNEGILATKRLIQKYL